MISASNLTKRYRDTSAVDDVSFTVTPRRVTGFLGPNGAGKSTTMCMILGLDALTSGSVIDGVDCDNADINDEPGHGSSSTYPTNRRSTCSRSPGGTTPSATH